MTAIIERILLAAGLACLVQSVLIRGILHDKAASRLLLHIGAALLLAWSIVVCSIGLR